MSTLAQIPIRVEGATGLHEQASVGGGLIAIIHEITALLDHLAETGEPSAIDVRSLPLSAADRAELLQVLGSGEVDIRIQANGESRIRETAVHGVWWTEHRDSDGALVANLIEVARVPEILVVADEELARAASRLRANIRSQSAAQGESPYGQT